MLFAPLELKIPSLLPLLLPRYLHISKVMRRVDILWVTMESMELYREEQGFHPSNVVAAWVTDLWEVVCMTNFPLQTATKIFESDRNEMVE